MYPTHCIFGSGEFGSQGDFQFLEQISTLAMVPVASILREIDLFWVRVLVFRIASLFDKGIAR
jgi:hypothetical protein